MVRVKAANQVSELWGDDPRLPAPESCKHIKFKRAIVVYFEPFSTRTNGQFFTRIYYKDFVKTITVADIEKFEKDVLELFDGNQEHGTPSEDPTLAPAFPLYYSADISNIRFGKKPCHVSYLMNSMKAFFLDPDGSKYTVPMIFRKDKIISREGLSGTKFTYLAEFEPNYSFYRLTVSNAPHPTDYRHAKCIRVFNYMRMGADGGHIDEDDSSGATRLDYAVDVPVMVEQAGLASFIKDMIFLPLQSSLGKADKEQPSTLEASERASILISNVLDHVAIVFDPPQSNGGNTGPP